MNGLEKNTILIVDDMEMNRQLLTVILGNNYHILEADNGLEALKILKREYEHIGLIMLDIVMPVMDGFALLERVKEDDDFGNIPIIFVTAETYKENVIKGVEEGVCDVIAKPFDPNLVIHRVDQLIKLGQSHQNRKCGYSAAGETIHEKKKDIVLIVDDVEMNRALLKSVLQEDYRIMEAPEGQEALKILRVYKDEIAVVLLDIIMPVMDGVEMMDEALKEELIDQIPVIAITADSSSVKMQRLQEMGICEIIHKPFDPYIVKNRIRNMIELYADDEMWF